MADVLSEFKGDEPYRVTSVRLRKKGSQPSVSNLHQMITGKIPVSKRVAEALGYKRLIIKHYVYEYKK